MKVFDININIIFLSILLSLSPHLYSQKSTEIGCGTITTSKSISFYNSINPKLETYKNALLASKTSGTKSSNSVTNSIPVKAHIIRKSDGTGGLTVSELEDAIANANVIFSDALMEFTLADEIDYIDDDSFYHFKSCDENKLVNAHNVPKVINIYFADYIKNTSNEDICGYTHTENRSNVIFMKNSCATNGSSLTHELGHFFSLIHTHGLDNNKLTEELVDGSNSATTGDLISDTPADPMLTSKNVNNFCHYVGCQTDANGDKFNPDTGNIMSYSMKGCRSHFSKQQLARMYNFYESIKADYFGEETDTSIASNPNSDSLKDIRLYPNPVTRDLLYIKFNSSEPINYKITNMMGQTYSLGSLTNTNQPINLSRLDAGTYIMTIQNKDSKVVKKFIK